MLICNFSKIKEIYRIHAIKVHTFFISTTHYGGRVTGAKKSPFGQVAWCLCPILMLLQISQETLFDFFIHICVLVCLCYVCCCVWCVSCYVCHMYACRCLVCGHTCVCAYVCCVWCYVCGVHSFFL